MQVPPNDPPIDGNTSPVPPLPTPPKAPNPKTQLLYNIRDFALPSKPNTRPQTPIKERKIIHENKTEDAKPQEAEETKGVEDNKTGAKTEKKKPPLSRVLDAGAAIFKKKETLPIETQSPQDKLVKTINDFLEVSVFEKIKSEYKDKKKQAKLASENKDLARSAELDHSLAIGLNEYKNALLSLEKFFHTHQINSSDDLVKQLHGQLAEFLNTPEGLDLVSDVLLKIPADQETDQLTQAIARIDVHKLKDLAVVMLAKKINSTNDPLMRQNSIAAVLYREVHLRIYGDLLRPVVRQCIQDLQLDGKGKVIVTRESLQAFLKNVQIVFRTPIPQAGEVHSLQESLRKAFNQQPQAQGLETPYMINMFLLRVIGHLMANPKEVGLEFKDDDPKKNAGIRFQLELIKLGLIQEGKTLSDPAFAPLLKEMLATLNPGDQV